MAAPKKEFYNCAHCGAGISINDSAGFTYRRPGDGLHHQISCSCGIMTRLCQTKQHLQMIWNSKPKKPYIPEKLEITYPGTRGAQPDDKNLTKDGEKTVDPF